MMKILYELKMTVDAKSVNESFCRAAVASFVSVLDPNIDELSDIKTSVSEAVTNCIVHAYKTTPGKIYISVKITSDGAAVIRIHDKGCGIDDVNRARQPLYTTGGDDRSGLGFSVMETFSDKLRVSSKPGRGTTVTITKYIRGKDVNDT